MTPATADRPFAMPTAQTDINSHQVASEQEMLDSEFTGEYRSISRAAIVSVVFGALGLLGLWESVFLILPLLSIIFAGVAIYNISRYPRELVGGAMAKYTLAASLIVFASGASIHTYIHQTEVPDGHVRMSFYDLKVRSRKAQTFYSEKAAELDGKRVFIKGYVRPSDKKTGLKNFILVGDFGSCCFGGNPKITDVVAIRIVNDQTVDYSYQLRRIAGTFRLNKQPVQIGEKDIPQVCYEIDADYIR